MLDTIFLVSAIAGGAALVLRAGLMLLGVGDDHALAHDASAAHGEGEAATRLLSIQGIAAFLVMFGLAGLAGLRQSHAPAVLAVPVAFGAGLGSMWIIGKIFQLMGRLQSSGTLHLDAAIGRQGVVYLTVRPGTGGQVQVEVQGRLGTFDACSAADDELATGRQVRVVGVRAGVLVVEALRAP